MKKKKHTRGRDTTRLGPLLLLLLLQPPGGWWWRCGTCQRVKMDALTWHEGGGGVLTWHVAGRGVVVMWHEGGGGVDGVDVAVGFVVGFV